MSESFFVTGDIDDNSVMTSSTVSSIMPSELARGLAEAAKYAYEKAGDAYEKAGEAYSSGGYGDYGATEYGGAYGGGGYAKEPAIQTDYTLLSVGVLTLALLLVVEMVRHMLDHKAHNRPFFHAVLEFFYSELATLGIVEFGVWIMQEYFEYNKTQKALFAKVHFLLFYTAILNAIQSVFLAICSSNVSTRMWVNTEELELNHYIAIREEFDKVEGKLNKYSSGRDAGAIGTHGTTPRRDRLAEETFSVRRGWKRFVRMLRHPALARKYEELLVQVRFHELRVHFIKANHLPLKFKVSEYLKKCELDVLVHLVHISASAWLMLMGLANLIYFLMGVVALVFGGARSVGVALKVILVGGCCLSVILSILIVQKVKWIFSQIMHMKLIDSGADDNHNNHSIRSGQHEWLYSSLRGLTTTTEATSRRTMFSHSSADKANINQLGLFWGSDPSYIISGIQLMQFGFSIFAPALIIFWEDINVNVGRVKGIAMAIIVVVSWLIFLYIMANVIPRYTLCTSLGQLVNVPKLGECLGKYRLEEALRKRRKQMDETRRKEEAVEISCRTKSSDGGKDGDDSLQVHENNALVVKPKSRIMRRSSDESEDSDAEAARSLRLADMVLKPTKDLPKLPPQSERRLNRKRMTKSASAALMRRSKSSSDGVAAMRMMSEGRATAGAKTSTNLCGDICHDDVDISLDSSRDRRPRPLRKSSSANVALMRSPQSALYADNGEDSFGDEEDNVPKTGDSQLRRKRSESAERFTSVSRGCVASPLVTSVSKSNVSALKPVLEGIPSHNALAPVRAIEPDMSAGVVPTKGLETSETGRSIQSGVDFSESNTRSDAADGIKQFDFNSDDDRSDVDDMPIPRRVDKKTDEGSHQAVTVSGQIRQFLLTRLYRLMSTVGGTMVCFFMVGMRMETLLIESNMIQESPSTFEIPRNIAFWIEVAWLIMFVLVSALTISVFSSCTSRHGVAHMTVAGVSDIILSLVCLALLLVSEWQRYTYAVDCATNCVGKIEPFTSLIALRELRFFWGKRTVKFWTKVKEHWGKMPGTSSVVMSTGSAAHFHSSEPSNALASEKGTMIELWRKALSLHPELVTEHGEFSSELLQAMLGIPIVATKPRDAENKEMGLSKQGEMCAKSASEGNRQISEMSLASDINGHAMDTTTSNDLRLVNTSLHLDDRYSNLSTDVQAIIYTGRVGRPVKCIIRRPSEDYLTSEDESVVGATIRNRNAGQPPCDHGVTKLAYDEKQVDIEEKEEDDGEMSVLLEPNARLIRSMRRCERRLPPMLDEWTMVDVVLTQFELVYFEVTDASISGDARCYHVREALTATNGGKKLRLRDVAYGRKIVGHVDLATVDVIKVQRYLAPTVCSTEGSDSDTVLSDFNENEEPGKVSEYWKGSPTPVTYANPSKALAVSSGEANQRRWDRVEEDRLRIHSSQGELYLRFFADLDESEVKVSRRADSPEGTTEKSKTALLWCKTIGRLRGKEHLKQKLPHFGDIGSGELDDYLEVIGRHHEENVGKAPRPSWNVLRKRQSIVQPSDAQEDTHAGKGSPSDLVVDKHTSEDTRLSMTVHTLASGSMNNSSGNVERSIDVNIARTACDEEHTEDIESGNKEQIV